MNDSPIDYVIGQELYTASVDEMSAWVEILSQEIKRLNVEIENKQTKMKAAESIFNK